MSRRTKDIGPRQLGELDEPFTYQFLDHDGEDRDLTGYTTAWIDYNTPDGTEQTGAAAVSNPANGYVQFPWVAAMTDTEGQYTAQIWVTDGTHKIASAALEWFVNDGPGPSS